jgi:hypothetical protein
MTQSPFTGSPFKTADNPQAPPPRRRGRPPGSGVGRKRKSLKTEIGGTLTMFNMGLQLSPFKRDALDDLEIEALSTALDEQAKSSPQFRKYLEYAIGITGAGGSLTGVVVMIAARRAARHGILPPEFDGQIGMLLAMTSGTSKLPDTPDIEPERSPFTDPDFGRVPQDEEPEPIATPIQPATGSGPIPDFGTAEVKVDE